MDNLTSISQTLKTQLDDNFDATAGAVVNKDYYFRGHVCHVACCLYIISSFIINVIKANLEDAGRHSDEHVVCG